MSDNNRKILVTNDDGITSDGLVRLVREAAKWGEVWVVAPDGQRSAASHSLTISEPLDVKPVAFPVDGVHAFSCSGLPSDCVRIGSQCLMPERPDIVFSGINNGYNVGTDIQYSATVAAALDATMAGFPAIAFSEGFAFDPRESGAGRKVTEAYLPIVMEELLSSDPVPGIVINVNFPDCPIDQCKGILRDRKVSMNNPYFDIFKLEEELPDKTKRYSVHWVDRDHADEGTDLRALLDGYVSIGVVHNIS
ncbi:MAG: 5'/3'-nucleotidase SurE [Clostridiales bacterium]|nr:5'/3'-nucleotidase SurE [Clostridiales bacterium]